MSNKYLTDIPFTEEPVVNKYVESFDLQNEVIDFDELNKYKDSVYALSRNNLQKLRVYTHSMEYTWTNNVLNNLDDKLQLFQSWTNNLAAASKEWEPGASKEYYKNDIVTYSEDPGAYFICLEDCDGTEPINYIKFTNRYNNTDRFNWGFCIDNNIMNAGRLDIGTPLDSDLPRYELHYDYDGAFNLKLTKKEGFVGEIDFLIFDGSKEIFEQMNYTVEGSKWLRIYLKGNVGLNSFNLTYKGEWATGKSNSMTLLPRTIKMLDSAQSVRFTYEIIYEIIGNMRYGFTSTISFEYGERKQIIKHFNINNIEGDIFLDYDGDSYFNARYIVSKGTTEEASFILRKNSSDGKPMPFNVVYLPNNIVYVKNDAYIDFYVCTSEVEYNNISPDQDTTHWAKLFSKQLDAFVILDEMPNQSWFDDNTNPSVFGVVSDSTNNIISIIDRVHSESANNPTYLLLTSSSLMSYTSDGYNFNTLIASLVTNNNI